MVQGRSDGSRWPASPPLDSPAVPARRGGSWEVAEKCGYGVDAQGRRRDLWAGLRGLWEVSTNPRQRACRRNATGELVAIEKRLDRASYSGLQTCGNPWTCPLCGPKIAAERGADIALALTEHHARGGRVALVTLTLRHTRAERLLDLLDGLGGAWTAIRQNMGSRALLSAHSDGWIKRLEVTLGPNGWHPHLHLLIFLRPGTTEHQARQLAAGMYVNWAGKLVRAGLGRPSESRGVDCNILDLAAAHEKVASYVAKSAALELASAGTKRARGENRTPMHLLADLVRLGLADDLAKWHEYEQAMRRKQQLRWSDGLRARLVGEIPELTDEQAAESNDGAARLLALLAAPTWRRIRASKLGPAAVLTWAELYDDDDEARDLIARQLARHGLGHLEAGQPPAQEGSATERWRVLSPPEGLPAP
jgi:hypothetical protein